MIGAGGVSQRLAKEGRIAKRVTDYFLAIVERSRIVPAGHRRHARTKVSPKELR